MVPGKSCSAKLNPKWQFCVEACLATSLAANPTNRYFYPWDWKAEHSGLPHPHAPPGPLPPRLPFSLAGLWALGWRWGPEGPQTAVPAGVGLAAPHCPSLVLALVLHIPEPLHFVPQSTEAEGPCPPWAHSELSTQCVKTPAAHSPSAAAICQAAPRSRRASQVYRENTVLVKPPSTGRPVPEQGGTASLCPLLTPSKAPEGWRKGRQASGLQTRDTDSLISHTPWTGQRGCTPHGRQTSSRQAAGETALGPKDGSGQARSRAGPLRSPTRQHHGALCVPHRGPRRAQAQWKHAHCAGRATMRGHWRPNTGATTSVPNPRVSAC